MKNTYIYILLFMMMTSCTDVKISEPATLMRGFPENLRYAMMLSVDTADIINPDVNRDGWCDYEDMSQLQSVLSLSSYSEGSDVDNDGQVDINDVIALNSYLPTLEEGPFKVVYVRLIPDYKHTFAIGDSASLTAQVKMYISGVQPDGSFYILPKDRIDSLSYEIGGGSSGASYNVYRSGAIQYTVGREGLYVKRYATDGLGEDIDAISFRGIHSWPQVCPPNSVTGLYSGYHYDTFSAADSVYTVTNIAANAMASVQGVVMTDTVSSFNTRNEASCATNAKGTLFPEGQLPLTGGLLPHSSKTYPIMLR